MFNPNIIIWKHVGPETSHTRKYWSKVSSGTDRLLHSRLFASNDQGSSITTMNNAELKRVASAAENEDKLKTHAAKLLFLEVGLTWNQGFALSGTGALTKVGSKAAHMSGGPACCITQGVFDLTVKEQ